ncbi:hypothetical protein PU02_0660 [Bartonella ancashensis]|uniref:Uncharacterized protein n=1 Tax=Bartonella ancashensis TaxID=1318743 RepID=A0A0M4M3A3_9HYPH|nr:hypothetical protein PU02_0660 [Bartonella ancashensis]
MPSVGKICERFFVKGHQWYHSVENICKYHERHKSVYKVFKM